MNTISHVYTIWLKNKLRNYEYNVAKKKSNTFEHYICKGTVKLFSIIKNLDSSLNGLYEDICSKLIYWLKLGISLCIRDKEEKNIYLSLCT